MGERSPIGDPSYAEGEGGQSVYILHAPVASNSDSFELQMKTIFRNFLAATLLTLGAALTSGQAAEPESPAWVAEKIAELQPKPEEKRLDQIGWASDIRQALALAEKHRRPVFLFTHDGRINLGRC
ncbi:MAG: hypothetical protein ACI9UA_002355 [Pseudoalteromonas tetraodonis]